MNILKKLAKITAVVLVLALPLLVYLNYQVIYDWWRLANYQPSQRVAEIAQKTTMSQYGQKLFYVNYPELLNKESFRQYCTNAEQSIVLGCYIDGQGIYIFDVSDERLAGVQEVTAAHEMLHAAYDRLSEKDKQKVDAMTSSAFEAINNQRIKESVEQYRSKDPTVVPNELHSILATEVRSLPSDLEIYYKRYFSDRLAVVALSENYEKVFTERENQIKAYDEQLKNLKNQIDKLQADLEIQAKSLSQRRSELEAMVDSGQIVAYNAAVASFNAQVASYNTGVKQVKALISQYNAIVAQRNAIASEEQELIDAIDTRLSPQSTE